MNTPKDKNLPSFTVSTPTNKPTLQAIKRIGTALSISAALTIGTVGCKTDSTQPTEETQVVDKDKKDTPEDYSRLNAEDLFLTAMIKFKGKEHYTEFGTLIHDAIKKDADYVLLKIEEHSEYFKERQDLFLYAFENVLGALDFADQILNKMRKKWGSEAAITLKIAEAKLNLALLENCHDFIYPANWEYCENAIPHFEDPAIRDGLRLSLIGNIEAKKEHILFSYIFITHDVIPGTAGKVSRDLTFFDDNLKTTFDLIDQLETKDQKTREDEAEKVIFNLSRDVGDQFLEPKERIQLMKDIMAVLAKYPQYNKLIKPLQETYTLASKMDNPSISDEKKAEIWEQVKAKLNKMYQQTYDTEHEINFD